MNVPTTAPEPVFSHPLSISILHDFRNPMATIRAASEILMRESVSDPQIHRIARNVQVASTRMQELLDDFFEQYAGVRRPARPTDIRELALRAVERIRERAEAQGVLMLQDLPEGITLSLDRHRIERVLVNVLCNSLEAMPKGGAIEVCAFCEADSVMIQVRDSGPGIAAELSGRLFEPFVTAGKPGGMGLGLAFSREAIVDHGGQMWAESFGQGSVFSMRLPRPEGSEAPGLRALRAEAGS